MDRAPKTCEQMIRLHVPFAIVALVFLAGCQPAMSFLPKPKVTSIEVHKDERRLDLLSYGFPVRRYEIDLGSNPIGPKRMRDDGKTPEGNYHITHLNQQSQFTLSLGLNYPNAWDQKIATHYGIDAGDGIFIHGMPNGKVVEKDDWTNGCIAVSNAEIYEIAALVRPGTPVHIHP